VLLVSAAGLAPAGDEPFVPLRPEAAVARGDALRGRALAATCAPCHGDTGVSPSAAFPIIAGQHYDYLVSAMLAYLSGSRQDSIMGGAIRTLSRTDIEDLAAYFAAQRGLGSAAAPATAVDRGSGEESRAGPAPPAPPASALATAKTTAEAARRLEPLPRRARATAGDARERERCAQAPDGLPDGFAVDADGDGYLAICNVAQWRALAQPEPSEPLTRPNPRWRQNYELVADIDLAGVDDLQPIGHCGAANNCMVSADRFGFAGHFDGNGHVIRGLRLERPAGGGVGLFGALARDGLITRLALLDAAVTGANGTALLVGANFGRIADCEVEGRVQGRVAIGGVAGGNAGRIEHVRARVDIAASAAVGGVVGDMNGVVADSYADVRIRADGKGVGGLVGLSTFGTLLRSAADGSVTGSDNVGGAVGVNTNALLAEVAVRVDATASGTNAGGLVGFNSQSLVRDGRASGLVRGMNAVGSLVGRNVGAVVSSFSDGKVEGRDAVDALIGDNASGTVIDAFALEPMALSAPTGATARWDAATWDLSGAEGRLPRLRKLPVVARPSEDAAPPRRNTMRPFAPGDVLVAATVMNDPHDDHAGVGRLLQYDADLRFKGELWLEGTRHKVGGLAFGPDRTLWAMAQLTPAVVEVAPNGRQRRYRAWSERKLSNVTFGPDRTLFFGEHLMGRATGHPSVTTKFNLLPGRNVIGDGHVFQFTRDGRLLREFPTAAHGGLFGFLAVTSTVLRDGGRRLVYLSETSNVIKQYDLAGDRQLPDLLRIDNDPEVPMLLVMNPMADGRVVVSTANGFIVVDPDTGRIARKYRLEGMGWAAIGAGVDNAHVFVGNFWSGELVKVRLSDGAVVARTNVQQRESLSGIAQFPG
jgi:cytochrome c553